MRSIFAAMGILVAGAATSAAAPLPSFCTGSLTVVSTGQFEPGSLLVNGSGASTGNCVEASDKIFGGFSVGGAITGTGSAGWLFTMASGPADVTIGFQGLVGPNMTGNVDYSVAVDPANSNGAMISALEKDFTLNAVGAGATATLTGTTSVAPVSFTGGDLSTGFQCTRTAAVSTCPQTGDFSPLIDMLTVDETIKTGPNTNVTALTDTVFQAVPEPSSTLGMLGLALVGMWLIGRGHIRLA